jgi:hypothetical protein
MKIYHINISNTLYSLYKESDDDYPTLMKEQSNIEKELRNIDKNLFIYSHEKRDIGECVHGNIFKLSEYSIQYFDDIDRMIKDKFGSNKYSCTISLEKLPYSRTNSTSKGSLETVIIKRKTFLKLSPYFHIRILAIIVLIILLLYLIYLLFQ